MGATTGKLQSARAYKESSREVLGLIAKPDDADKEGLIIPERENDLPGPSKGAAAGRKERTIYTLHSV